MTNTLQFENNHGNKTNGSNLTADEWNRIMLDLDTLVNNVPTEVSGGSGDSVVTTETDPEDADKTFVKVGSVTVAELTSKGEKGTNVGLAGNNNINIEPRPAAGDGSGKNTPGLANRKGGNIALKPGDDIEFWAHKRGSSKNDEVSVKMLTEVPKAGDPTKTDEVAAKLQLNTADIVLTSKDKLTQSDEMNITVNKAADTRGYLKVRAQAIDLRSETHGGIALQPRGEDGSGNEDKIKFEHGGGDGLEFGTFNTEKSSLFTNEYRFKKDGVIKLATRTKLDNTPGSNGNNKYTGDNIDPTTHYSYQKQADDFYDIIDVSDPTCTWSDVISYVAWAKREKQGPWAPISPILTFDSNNYVAYIGELDKVNATINPSSLQSQVRYYSDNDTELDLSSSGYIEPTTTGTYQVAAQFAGNSQYNAVTARTSVIVKPARQDVTLTMTDGGVNTWSASNASINNNAYTLEVGSTETINGAFYNWSTYPEGILTFTPASGHPDGDIVSIGLVDPNYTGTFTVYAEFLGTDDYKPTEVSHTYTITA